jgi:lambda repressor-like predicted transcriptional regulator
MTINPISNQQQIYGTDPSGLAGRSSSVYNAVAGVFKETPDQLTSELQAPGASLTSIAQQKGVSQTDLVNAIKQGLQQTNANFSDTQLTNIANRIANHKHGHHHHHHADADADATQSTPSTDPLQQLLSTPSTSTDGTQG